MECREVYKHPHISLSNYFTDSVVPLSGERNGKKLSRSSLKEKEKVQLKIVLI